MLKRVLSIGQCQADHASISSLIEDRFDAQVVAASGLPEARQALDHERFALILINRLLDADGSPGLDALKHIRTELPDPPPIMLVTNFADQQQLAVQAGCPGFGKAALRDPQTLERLEPYLS